MGRVAGHIWGGAVGGLGGIVPTLPLTANSPLPKSLCFRKQQAEKFMWQSLLYFHSARDQGVEGSGC